MAREQKLSRIYIFELINRYMNYGIPLIKFSQPIGGDYERADGYAGCSPITLAGIY